MDTPCRSNPSRVIFLCLLMCHARLINVILHKIEGPGEREQDLTAPFLTPNRSIFEVIK
jgi:hypothetical protein